jgi:hypothetical protein
VFGTPKSHQTRSVPVPCGIADDLAVHLAEKSQDDLPELSRYRRKGHRRRGPAWPPSRSALVPLLSEGREPCIGHHAGIVHPQKVKSDTRRLLADSQIPVVRMVRVPTLGSDSLAYPQWRSYNRNESKLLTAGP